MEPNPFTKQGKALPCEVRDVIVEKWLRGSKEFDIARQLRLSRNTVANIVDRFVRTGSVQLSSQFDCLIRHVIGYFVS